MENKHLKKIQKLLNNYFSYFKSDDVLVISEDKAEMPFAYIINDSRYKNTLLLCLAIDYANPIHVAEVSLKANKVLKLELSEAFYINPMNGVTYFDEDAYYQYNLQSLDLDTMVPYSNASN
jgi:hypothetical protein